MEMTDDLVEKVARAIVENDDPRVWHAWCGKARSALSAIEDAGFVIVPKEPTEKMKHQMWFQISIGHPDGGDLSRGTEEIVYTAMLSARPRITGETK